VPPQLRDECLEPACPEGPILRAVAELLELAHDAQEGLHQSQRVVVIEVPGRVLAQARILREQGEPCEHVRPIPIDVVGEPETLIGIVRRDRPLPDEPAAIPLLHRVGAALVEQLLTERLDPRHANERIALRLVLAERVRVVRVVEDEALVRLDGVEELAGVRQALVVVEPPLGPNLVPVHHFIRPDTDRSRRQYPAAGLGAVIEPGRRRSLGRRLVEAERVVAVAAGRNAVEALACPATVCVLPLEGPLLCDELARVGVGSNAVRVGARVVADATVPAVVVPGHAGRDVRAHGPPSLLAESHRCDIEVHEQLLVLLDHLLR
jgi:hypothetical protein